MKVIEKIGDYEKITEISSDELHNLMSLMRASVSKPFREKLQAFIEAFLKVEDKKS